MSGRRPGCPSGETATTFEAAQGERERMKAEVVDLLTAMGLAMKKRGDLGRGRAYTRAANAIQRRTDFEQLLEDDRLQDVPGIGASIEATIKRFVGTGERPEWAPASLLDEASAAGAAEGIASIPAAYRRAPFPGAPDLHVHTTWSDGTLTLDEVVAFAERRGPSASATTAGACTSRAVSSPTRCAHSGGRSTASRRSTPTSAS
jgi:hypothetical protein